MQFNLMDLDTVLRSIGRGVVFYAVDDVGEPERWSPGTPLRLAHLGDTEGDIVCQTNPGMEGLTTPELTGPAVHEMDYTGENPVYEMPFYLVDPIQRSLISPTGTSSAGRSRRSAPLEHTLVIFPEALFLKVDADRIPQRVQLEHASGAWAKDGDALGAHDLALLDNTVWQWRGCFNRPPRSFKGGAGEARKNIETASFQGLHHNDMPEGHKLYTIGNPDDFDIDIDGGS